MSDWADKKAKEFLNDRWPSFSVDPQSLAALLREVAASPAPPKGKP